MSEPLKPIQITREGDRLEEYPPPPENPSHHRTDESHLGSNGAVGVHMYCDGWMNRTRSTEDADSISCRRCFLRVLIPRATKTYGELRLFSIQKFGPT